MSTAVILTPQTRPAEDDAAPAIIDRGYQPEVQGLRAIAVGLVLLYHFWPTRLTGGFIGVDIFFVVSGFLISSHMYREASRTGRVKLGRFWARRIRRLLPISLLVLVVSLIASLVVLPRTIWSTTFRQIAASALYAQNWILAGDAVDYSAADNAATLVQHYWSLSVEEQFYMVWPVIFMGAIAISLSRRKGAEDGALPRRGYAAILVALTTLCLASLTYSVLATNADSARAYFVTPTRVWEFAAGSLVALVLLGRQYIGRRATVLAWAALAAVLASAFLYSSATSFPGWLALFPVLGTCILLSSTGSFSVFAPRWWLSLKPMTFLGDISYGIYLWHWPVIVIARNVLDKEPALAVKVALIAFTVLLAFVSKKYVEDPWRHGQVIGTTRRAMTFAAVGTVVIALSAFSLVPRDHSTAQSLADNQSGNPCFGPGGLVGGVKCSVRPDEKPEPGPVAVIAENTKPAYPGCQGEMAGTAVVSCGLGAAAGSAVRTVAIIGDSHATQWFPALDRLGKTRNWHIKTFTKAGCPVTFALRGTGVSKAANEADCLKYSRDVTGRIARDPSISLVFAANRSYAYGYVSRADLKMKAPAVDGYAEVWSQLLDARKKVVVLGEIPNLGSKLVPVCLDENPDHSLVCSRPAADAVPKSPALARAAEQLKARGVRYMAMRDYFCDASRCYAVVGGLITYRDSTHLTTEYSMAMAPYIGKFLDRSGIR